VVLHPLRSSLRDIPACLFLIEQGDMYCTSSLSSPFPPLPPHSALTRWNVRVQGSKGKVDGSFIATILETASVGVLYLAWKSITEGTSFHHRVSSLPNAASITWPFFSNLVMLTIVFLTESWEEEPYYSP
jgi:hypothetical protein